MDERYCEAYRGLFEKHWWWRSRNEFILEKLRELQPSDGWQRILDVGCGDGLFFDRLAEFGEVEGVEPSLQLVNPANPHRRNIYVCPFDSNFRPNKLYSLILMLDVLEHLPDATSALIHAVELLSSGGVFIATLPAFMSLWTNHDVLNHHYTRYTKGSFSRVAQTSGLCIYEQRYIYHWMFPAKLCTRFLETMAPSEPTPAKTPPKWLNNMFYAVSRVEQRTISRFPMPFGSSLIVVAGKNP